MGQKLVYMDFFVIHLPPSFFARQIPNDVLWVLDSRHDMYCGIFDATGEQFFSASQVNLVNLDDETSQIRVFHLANDMGANDVFSLSFCGVDSTKLICGRNRGRLTLCNLETGTCEELDASPRPGADINAVATLDDSGDTFVTGGDDTCIRVRLCLSFLLSPPSARLIILTSQRVSSSICHAVTSRYCLMQI
ncbi:unnamed protein product [Dibothriocephalus latus]|uniref:Uncharacterized protein n=1 Tax=Dibothriocephalus latus TaxID=60516 RepID=A0A3P7PEK3_DIBLA|nr:unnamed protein product [Dibothriocephalus latus]